jgi:hypothetical protein
MDPPAPAGSLPTPSPPRVWTSAGGEPCIVTLTNEAIHVARPRAEEAAALEKRLLAGESPTIVLSSGSETISLAAMCQLEANLSASELTIDYLKEPNHQRTQHLAVFSSKAQVEDTLAQLRKALGSSWKMEECRQSVGTAATLPCKTLFGLVGIPLVMVLSAVLGGGVNADFTGKDAFGCLYGLIVIALVAVGVIYLGTGKMLIIGAGLLLAWVGWLGIRVLLRPTLTRLVRQ